MVTLKDIRLFAKYHLFRRVYDHPAPEVELGVEILDFDPARYRHELDRHSDRFVIETVVELGYQGVGHPIHLVRSVAPGTRRTLLVLAGVHGNEQAGLWAIPRLLAELSDDVLSAVELCILTPVNPVGAAHDSRYNGDGYDINRDFVRFDTVEASTVRSVVDDCRPDFIVSLHEGPQDGAFLFSNPRVSRARSLRLLSAMRRRGTELASEDYFGRRLDPPGYAPISKALLALSLLWARTLGMMATGVWADRLGLPEVTLESSWRCSDADQRIDAHVRLVRAVLDEIR